MTVKDRRLRERRYAVIDGGTGLSLPYFGVQISYLFINILICYQKSIWNRIIYWRYSRVSVLNKAQCYLHFLLHIKFCIKHAYLQVEWSKFSHYMALFYFEKISKTVYLCVSTYITYYMYIRYYIYTHTPLRSGMFKWLRSTMLGIKPNSSFHVWLNLISLISWVG